MPKRVMQGVVVSDKNTKTVVVQVQRTIYASPAEEDGAPVHEVPRA